MSFPELKLNCKGWKNEGYTKESVRVWAKALAEKIICEYQNGSRLENRVCFGAGCENCLVKRELLRFSL